MDPQLAASAITDDTARKAGVYRITTEDAHRLGFVGNGYDSANLSGLAFPYRHPRTGAHLVTRLRPDTSVQGRKYLAPIGSRNHFYVPGATETLLDDVRFDALIVEGEKKALATLEVVGHRALVVGLSGVWNWRTSDKEKRPERDHPGTRTVRVNSRPVEDFDWIIWKGRRVFVLFDSDGNKNQDVQKAELALCVHLRKLGAEPMVVSIPPQPDGGKQGIDDFFARLPASERAAALKRLLNDSAPRRKLRLSEARSIEFDYQPSTGFLRDFCDYVQPITDAPDVYHPFTGLVTLSAVVGRNVTAQFGPQRIVPNQFLCILGQSSLFRKSTMITIAQQLVEFARPESVLPNEFTPEKLLELLQKSPVGFFAWKELTGYLARAGRDYMGGAKEVLMELYDCPSEYRREIKSSSVRIEQPAISVFAASATAWLSEQLKGPDLRSGFLNRFCFVLAEKKTRFLDIPPPPDVAQRNRLIRSLHEIGGISGDADFSRIKTRYRAWLRDHESEILRSDHPEIVSAFYTRLSITALKYAILIELSQSRQLSISCGALDEALTLVDYLKAVIAHLLRLEFAPTDSAKRIQQVLKVIRATPGGAQRGQMLKRIGLNAKELTIALQTLVEQGDAYEDGGRWWPSE
ncbi:MAG TPA: DUF3987 domain-containing protein [Vicinamibacterales bacterium]|nr:DUF3987 domain-containing protein [Vicinamibacterales bacterium]